MKKVKLFKFEVSNWSSRPIGKDSVTIAYEQSQAELVSEEDIEFVINAFISDKKVAAIDVRTIEINKHNNGRGNTVHLLYTILYS